MFVYTEYFIALRGGCEHLKIQQLFQVSYSLSSSFVLNDLFSWVLVETLAAYRDCNYVKKNPNLSAWGKGSPAVRKQKVHFVGVTCWLSPDTIRKEK